MSIGTGPPGPCGSPHISGAHVASSEWLWGGIGLDQNRCQLAQAPVQRAPFLRQRLWAALPHIQLALAPRWGQAHSGVCRACGIAPGSYPETKEHRHHSAASNGGVRRSAALHMGPQPGLRTQRHSRTGAHSTRGRARLAAPALGPVWASGTGIAG